VNCYSLPSSLGRAALDSLFTLPDSTMLLITSWAGGDAGLGVGGISFFQITGRCLTLLHSETWRYHWHRSDHGGRLRYSVTATPDGGPVARIIREALVPDNAEEWSFQAADTTLVDLWQLVKMKSGE